MPNTTESQCPQEEQPVRSRYFHGMLLTDDDFRAEQEYHLAKQRLHNRYLHGYGTVCGLAVVETHPVSNLVVVQPGLAIDCCGRELVVTTRVDIDPRALAAQPRFTGTLFVTVAYDEVDVGHAPAMGESGEHQATRVREIARIGVTTHLPRGPGYVETGGVLECTDCEEPAVALAAIDLSQKGPITQAQIDNTVRPALARRGAVSQPPPSIASLERKVDLLTKALGVAGGLGVAAWWRGRRT
jgi:hypothetical protein